MEQMKLYTHDEMMDSVIGKKGTPRRNKLDADLKTFLMGEAIRKAREERHLTQEQLGNLIGVKNLKSHGWKGGQIFHSLQWLEFLRQ